METYVCVFVKGYRLQDDNQLLSQTEPTVQQWTDSETPCILSRMVIVLMFH